MKTYEIPEELKYSRTHEWVRNEGDGIIVVGITEHAERLLGDMVFVEMPEVGEEVKALDEIGVLESVKAASDFYTPVSGEIVEANNEVCESPAIINTDPYGDGWLVKVRMRNSSELDDLLTAEEYQAQIEKEED